MSNIKLCQKCREKNNKDLFYSGYYNWLSDDCYECPMKDCGHKLIDVDLSKEDFDIIISISKDINFIEAMIDLKETDIIDYNLKMSQFRTQVEQQNQAKQQTDNTPHCPKCGSTQITTGARGVNHFWGFIGASKTVNRCGSCGHTWTPKG